MAFYRDLEIAAQSAVRDMVNWIASQCRGWRFTILDGKSRVEHPPRLLVRSGKPLQVRHYLDAICLERLRRTFYFPALVLNCRPMSHDMRAIAFCRTVGFLMFLAN